MDKKNLVTENLESLFESFKKFLNVKTVVGEAVQIGDTTIVPFVNVTIGFGTGGFMSDSPKAAASGGAKVTPTAVLVIKGERIEMFSVNGDLKTSGFERLVGMVPELISKLKKDKYIYINENA